MYCCFNNEYERKTVRALHYDSVIFTRAGTAQLHVSIEKSGRKKYKVKSKSSLNFDFLTRPAVDRFCSELSNSTTV